MNYFIDSLLLKKYGQVKAIDFNGYTEETMSDFAWFNDCFKGNDSLPLKLRVRSFDKMFARHSIATANIDQVSIHPIKKKNTRQLSMRVFLANEIADKTYIMITIHKRYQFTDAYMFECSKSGEVLRWCKTGMIH
ncbi:hypothetical protein [Paraflavitalea pollutisoli]|uniref:hypothetical protein n=1 Tax=Paraflavitalea pollutisoli TaxID=3034143 RepID=UPI0023ED1F39|nr:hypothetical protein [Paraflavitalea sp. H1-2-19X]